MSNKNNTFGGLTVGLIEWPTNPTWNDVMDMWPKKPLERVEPPISIRPETLAQMEKAYQKVIKKKNI